jgi:uncharacterized protein YjbI with pentapeptide repeats
MKVQAPKLPVQLDELAAPLLHDDELFEGQRIVELDAVSAKATNVSFDECELYKPMLSQARLEKLQLRDVRIIGGDCTAANASDGGSLRVTFDDVRMTGFDASRSIYKEVCFKNCKIDMANFRFSKLKNIRFEDCNLTDCDFQSAQLTNVVFRNCILQKLLLSNAVCKQVDMRTSQIDNLIGWRSASSITIDSVQLMHLAPELAEELKIIVTDD